MLQDTPTQGSTTPTQHLLQTQENLNEIHNYSTIAHSHTRTQRPQMTSGRVIWPLLFFLKEPHTKQKKNKCMHTTDAYCSTSMMLHISALQGQVVNGRQSFRHTIRAHFTYRVGGKHCKRIASLYKHMGNTLGSISPI